MIDELLPDIHLEVADVEVDELSLCDEATGDEVGEEGDHIFPRQERGDDVRPAYLEDGKDLQRALSKLAVKDAAIALAALGEDEGLG